VKQRRYESKDNDHYSKYITAISEAEKVEKRRTYVSGGTLF